jgi:hypothetical protein
MVKANRARRRLTLNGAPSPSSFPDVEAAPLQARADAVHDLLELIATAERRGFSARRAAIIGACASRMPPIAPDRVRAIELAIRGWLRRRPM